MQSIRNQQGVVLIVALITLLLISIVGVGIMSTINLEEKMVAGAVDNQRAFQAAEGALRVGEQWALEQYHQNRALNLNHDYVNGGSNTPFSVHAANGSTLTASYIVRPLAFLRPSIHAGESLDSAGLLVQVTAYSDGLTGNANVELQSTYIAKD